MGGTYERELRAGGPVSRAKAQAVISAHGCLPCPFFFGHAEPQLAGLIKQEMSCRCGSVPLSLIESVLLDPRNSSPQFWRERSA